MKLEDHIIKLTAQVEEMFHAKIEYEKVASSVFVGTNLVLNHHVSTIEDPQQIKLIRNLQETIQKLMTN